MLKPSPSQSPNRKLLELSAAQGFPFILYPSPPLASISPSTCSFEFGLVVPIPTLPEILTVILELFPSPSVSSNACVPSLVVISVPILKMLLPPAWKII